MANYSWLQFCNVLGKQPRNKWRKIKFQINKVVAIFFAEIFVASRNVPLRCLDYGFAELHKRMCDALWVMFLLDLELLIGYTDKQGEQITTAASDQFT